MMSLPPSDGLSRHLDTLPRHRCYRHRVMAIYIVSLCVMLALFGLEELLERQTAGVPDREVQVQAALESLTRYLPLIDELGVLNADGRARVSSGDNRHADRDLSQTALFRGFSQSAYDEVVTPLYWSAQDQRFYLYHARRLGPAEGAFNGVVVARLLPEMFSAALRHMGVEEGESVALGREIDATAYRDWLVSDDRLHVFTMLSPLDDKERLFHVKRVADYPVMVVVAVDVQRLLASWRQRAWLLSGVMALLGALGAWVARHYLHRLALGYQLQARQVRLDALIHSAQDMIFVFDGHVRVFAAIGSAVARFSCHLEPSGEQHPKNRTNWKECFP